MAKCRRSADGNICDYFEYGVDDIPEWYFGEDLGVGTFVVKDDECRFSKYHHHTEFMKFYEWVYDPMKF